MGMYALTNVPRACDKGSEIKVEVQGNDIILWHVHKSDDRGSKMATIFVGDHMLVADNHRDLLELIGRELASAVTRGRDAGYSHAKREIREALGIS